MAFINKPIHHNHGGRRPQTDGIVYHSSGSVKLRSLWSMFNNPASKASSHSHVADDGYGERYLDDDVIAWALAQGNRRMVVIETQGDGSKPWTPAQLDAIVEETVRLVRKYRIPLRLMRSSRKSEKGLGYHRLGVPRSRWGKGLWLVAGGEIWSRAVGKICPGDARIAQMPEILRRVKEALGDDTPVEVPKAVAQPKKVKPKKVKTLLRGSRGTAVKRLQRGLNKVFPTYRHMVKVGKGRFLSVDGIYGGATDAWVKVFQRRVGLHVDGVCGPMTRAALKRYGIKL